MHNVLLYALGSAIVAGLLTNLVVPSVTRLAIAIRAVDHPGERRLHVQPVPRLGGVAIAIGLSFGAGAAAVSQWNRWGMHIGRDELLGLALGTAIVFLVGVVDDLVGVSSSKKFLLELFAAWLLVRVGWSF